MGQAQHFATTHSRRPPVAPMGPLLIGLIPDAVQAHGIAWLGSDSVRDHAFHSDRFWVSVRPSPGTLWKTPFCTPTSCLHSQISWGRRDTGVQNGQGGRVNEAWRSGTGPTAALSPA
ncbi:hypothetical protein GCM10009674_13350 [Nesterenkonia xinjiangensis]